MLREKLKELEKEFVKEAFLAEQMVRQSINGLIERDSAILEKVMEEYEPEMNEFEIKIDEECTSIIALYQPKAKDLRTILMILKMNNDLERIGDLAVNISESGLFLLEHPHTLPLKKIREMAENAASMLKDSITSFLKEDPVLAKEVCERDDIVDDYRRQIIRELISYMTNDPRTIEPALHLLRISKNLERVADLSTNIAEDVIFMVKGKIIKHHKDEEQNE